MKYKPLTKSFRPVQCAASNCPEDSTIIHGDEPLCGKHALERLDGPPPRPQVKAAADQP